MKREGSYSHFFSDCEKRRELFTAFSDFEERRELFKAFFLYCEKGRELFTALFDWLKKEQGNIHSFFLSIVNT